MLKKASEASGLLTLVSQEKPVPDHINKDDLTWKLS